LVARPDPARRFVTLVLLDFSKLLFSAGITE
jgi:hypothetical protein